MSTPGRRHALKHVVQEPHDQKAGRVDHRDSALDYDGQERERKITIYAKQTRFAWKENEIFVIDTPGHIDFSTEMERSLQVLDAAILLINAQDGVQSHTETIWNCLQRYKIPTWVFVNKMDISFQSRQDLMADLERRLSANCIDMEEEGREEKLAMVNDELLTHYTEDGTLPLSLLQEALCRREWFPVYFGSALKHEGIEALLDSITTYTLETSYPKEFGARVFKINEEGIAFIKMTGGTLSPKEVVEGEKIDQIRAYQGEKYTLVQQASAGDIVGLKGAPSLRIGQGLGFENDQKESLLNACLEYELLLPEGVDAVTIWPFCEKLAKSDPGLELAYHSAARRSRFRSWAKSKKKCCSDASRKAPASASASRKEKCFSKKPSPLKAMASAISNRCATMPKSTSYWILCRRAAGSKSSTKTKSRICRWAGSSKF